MSRPAPRVVGEVWPSEGAPGEPPEPPRRTAGGRFFQPYMRQYTPTYILNEDTQPVNTRDRSITNSLQR